MVKSLDPIKITQTWLDAVRNASPSAPKPWPARPRRLLVISESTGYRHWVTPHTTAVLKVLAESTGAFTIDETDDPRDFFPANLRSFDGLVFNNTCASTPHRDLFFDLLGDEDAAAGFRSNIIDYVAGGGAMISLHGGLIAFNEDPEWDRMHGGSFDYHPAQQELRLDAVEPDHRLGAAFGDQPFFHVDEPYLYKGSYAKHNFRPLLAMQTSALIMPEGKQPPSGPCYVAWIKRYQSGRVFYCSPSHNAQSFEDPRLLRFVFDGIRYAVGDLPCDDSPLS